MKIYPCPSKQLVFLNLLDTANPFSFAQIIGNTNYPDLHGMAYFYDVPFGGIFIEVEVCGLPIGNAQNRSHFLGMHIHEFADCTRPFENTGNHYNPSNMPHPLHAGDLPPLLNNDGYAYSAFYTSYLSPKEIIGKSLIIHSKADDFTTQPSGNSGDKIACGEIYQNIS